MLQIIIFSYNRALQLDTLLTSLFEHWKSIKICVDVLYNNSSEDYEKAYKIVKKKFSYLPVKYHKESIIADKVEFSLFLKWDNVKRFLKYPFLRHAKTNFRSLLIKTIEESPYKHLMFLTDDAMFIKDVNIPQQVFTWINERQIQRQFILRIGEGFNDQPKNIVRKENGFLKWNMYDAEYLSNWGYNFSVDAHIYNKDIILSFLKKIWLVNPSTFEGYMCHALRKKKMMGEGMAFEYPSLLSFPINMVQTVSQNESLGVDCKQLNDYYLDGYTMKYPIPDAVTKFQVYPYSLLLYKANQEIQLKIR